MRRIKILRIIARLNIGGPAIHAVLLTEALAKNNFETILICGNTSKNEGDMSYYANEKNIKPYIIPELTRELNLLNDLFAFFKIFKVIKAVNPDIVHTHTAKAGTLGRLAAILYNSILPKNKKRIKIIHTFHGHVFSGYFGKFKTKTFLIIERFLSFFTSKILTVSESVKAELVTLRVSSSNKIDVIPLGFELGKFLSVLPRESNVLNIGIVGRLVPIKNHRLFLDAALKVVQGYHKKQVCFKIIGDGELRGELIEYSRKIGIDKYVDFLGWQKNLPFVYTDLDIVALTSSNEGTPVSLIEAMASARAVIATDVGGVKDLLGVNDKNFNYIHSQGFKVLERGILVEPGDHEKFFEGLIFLFDNDDLRKKMGEEGRNFAMNKFDKDRLINDMQSLYTNLLP